MTDSGSAPEKFVIVVFSYNRPQYLENCLLSICENGNLFTTYVIDDDSNHPDMQKILKKFENRINIFYSSGLRSIANGSQRHGGLYTNMNLMLEKAAREGWHYVLFIQDDMQLVRPITDIDITYMEKIFSTSDRITEIHTCFQKHYHNLDINQYLSINKEIGFYKWSPAIPADCFAGFTDPGVFHVERMKRLFGPLAGSEKQNDRIAQDKGLAVVFSAYPFMMWLPFPISFRQKRKGIPRRLVEWWIGAGFHPYRTMSTDQISNLWNRNIEQLPLAQEQLETRENIGKRDWVFDGSIVDDILSLLRNRKWAAAFRAVRKYSRF